nr:hypothetical protein [Kineothrix alysoides]
MGKEVIFLGDGVPVFREQLRLLMEVPYHFAPAHLNRQRAASVAAIGGIYYKSVKSWMQGSCSYLSPAVSGREGAE